jgi:hypothetical protein
MIELYLNSEIYLNCLNEIEIPTNRSFGLTIGSVILLCEIYIDIKSRDIHGVLAGIAIALFIISIFAPKFLKYPNIVWTLFGVILGKITTPIVLSVIYFGLFAPLGLLKRVFKSKTTCKSYWIKKTNHQLDDNLKHQF